MKKLLIAILVLCAVPAFAQRRGFGAIKLSDSNITSSVQGISNWYISGSKVFQTDTTKSVMIGTRTNLGSFGGAYHYWFEPTGGTGPSTWVLGSNATGNHQVWFIEDADGTPNYGGFGLASNNFRMWTGASINANYIDIGTANITVDGNFIPNADGTLNLGVQTTGQWANVWADLVNGADIALNNNNRILESEKYKGYYNRGIAFGNTHFKDGIVTEKMPEDAKPYFVASDKYFEFLGRRFYEKDFDKLIQQGIGESKPDSFLKKAEKYILYGSIAFIGGIIGGQL